MRWFLGVFTAMAVVGVIALIVVGFPAGPTEVLPTPQTLPPERDAATTTTPVADAAFPDGSPAPAGVSEVLVADRSTSLSFEIPDDLDVDALRPAVAPVDAAAVGDGNGDPEAISVRVQCAESVDEVLAQISVSESDEAITVLAVVLVPDDGAPCDSVASGDGPVVEIPLLDPIGARPIEVVPAGTPVPDLDAGR